jgi:hypothetical protein
MTINIVSRKQVVNYILDQMNEKGKISPSMKRLLEHFSKNINN